MYGEMEKDCCTYLKTYKHLAYYSHIPRSIKVQTGKGFKQNLFPTLINMHLVNCGSAFESQSDIIKLQFHG